MEKKEYIITSEKGNENYSLYTYTLRKIKEWLENKYKKSFSVNRMFGGTFRNKIYDDLYHNEDGIEALATILEHYEDASFNSAEKDVVFRDDVYNTLLYYPNYELAYAYIKAFLPDGIKSYEVILYADEKKYKNFIEEAKRKEKDRKNSDVIVFTDTMNGLTRVVETITRMVERKDVFMKEEIKESIYKSIDHFFQENETFYTKYNIPHKKGILLYGEPGNGKTTIVKSIAASVKSPVVYWQINEFTSSGSISKVFEECGNLAPAVLVIEDLDSMPAACRSTFLNTLDGATTKEGIFLIGTTNYPERIDKALINRAGRFDRTYEIELPTEELRFQYLLNRGTLDFITAVEIKKIAEETEGFSFVQLNELFITIATDHHHESACEYDKIFKQMKQNNKKATKNDWKTEEKGTLGFK